MELLRILFFAPRIPVRPFDGGALSIYHQVRGLQNAGHAVTVVAPNTSRHYADDAAIHEFCDDVITHDVDTVIRPIDAIGNLLIDKAPYKIGFPKTPYTVSRFLHRSLVDKIHQRVNTSAKYDVIHIDYLTPAWYAFELKRALPAKTPPLLFRAHNVESRIIAELAQDKNRSIAERLYRRLVARQTQTFEQEVGRRSNLIVAVSQADADWFSSACPDVSSIVIPVGVEAVDVSKLTRAKRLRPTIGFLGSLEWGPNVEGILWFVREVVPLVIHALPEVEIRIAGRSPAPEVLALHNGTNVFIDGPVKSATEFLTSVDVAVSPILSGSGVRIKILEGLAHAKPMVTTSAGAEGLPVSDGVHIVIADDAAAFAQGCIRLVNDARYAVLLGNNGRDLVTREFSWGESIRNLIAAYESIALRR